MSNNLRINAFCNLFQEFLVDLQSSFPQEDGLKFVLSSLKVMRGLGQDKIIAQGFMEHVGPFADKIIAKDESFFLQNDFEAPEGFIADEVARVKGIWTDPITSKETKDCIHAYFVSLLKIGKSCTF